MFRRSARAGQPQRLDADVGKAGLLEVAPDHGLVEVREGHAVERGRVDREKVPQRLVGELGHGVVLDRVPGAEEERTVFAQHTMRFAERLRTVTVEHHAELRGYAVERGVVERQVHRVDHVPVDRCVLHALAAEVDHGGIEIGSENARLLAGDRGQQARQPTGAGGQFENGLRRKAADAIGDGQGEGFEEHRTEVAVVISRDLTRECNGGCLGSHDENIYGKTKAPSARGRCQKVQRIACAAQAVNSRCSEGACP